MATPKSTVTTPSTRNSLQIYQGNQLTSISVQTKAETLYHCHPDSPPAPEMLSKANAKMPLTTPEKFPSMSAWFLSATDPI